MCTIHFSHAWAAHCACQALRGTADANGTLVSQCAHYLACASIMGLHFNLVKGTSMLQLFAYLGTCPQAIEHQGLISSGVRLLQTTDVVLQEYSVYRTVLQYLDTYGGI